ncbi:hypothetical protein FCM35_KLT22412 [Carex littledalei]|uniref:CCHC-type domain-containing protein n=1 Tax=Carex littledalei TaxID=544730 RepID=A0A833QBR0_9POAL|nr:hypothetical protein FCM35_KLT22412 [Carex littledalei]
MDPATRNSFSPLSGLDPHKHIEQLENALQAFKQGLAMANGPVLPLPLDKRSAPDHLPMRYSEALLKPPVKPPPDRRQNVRSYWRARGLSNLEEVTRSGIVRAKIESLRAASSPQNPICFRCTEKGHLATDCRNAQVCFICNKLGHRAPRCRSVTTNPPSPTKKPSPHSSNGYYPSILLKPPPKPPINTSTAAVPMSKSMKAPIRTLYETPASEAQEQQFRRSFFLDDAPGWGRARIETALHKLMRHHTWLASRWDESRYLIEAPSPTWLDDTLHRGTIRLDNVIFKVSPWDPCFSEGLRMIPCWVRIRGFPHKFWEWEEFEGVFSDFGATVLELDPGTQFKYERRFARVRLGMCDPMLLPSTHWLMHRDPGGYLSRFDLIFELEHERNSGPGAWVRKTVTTDPPNDAPGKPKGVAIVDRTISTAKPPKKSAPPGKGKGVAAHDSDESDADSEYEFDAQGNELYHWSKFSPEGSSRVPILGATQLHPLVEAVRSPLSDPQTTYADPVSASLKPTVPVQSPSDPPLPPDSTTREITWAPCLAADGTSPLEVQCGLVEGLTYEKCAPRQVLVHTNQGVIQCEPRDIFSAMIDHLTSQQKTRPTRRASSVPPSSTTHSSLSSPPLSPSLSARVPLSPSKRSLVLTETPAQTDEIPASKRLKGGTLRRRTSTSSVIPRRSLRIVAQGASETVLAKAQKLAQARTSTASSSSGIPLLNSFPFTRLTDEEIEQLFQVYNIRFGLANLSKTDLIRAIQILSRAEFDKLISQAFDSLKKKPSDNQLVVIEQDSQGFLTVL